MAAPTLSEELYFGSVDVSFSATPGQAFASPPNTWSDLVSVGSKSVANARFEMAQWLGDGYSTLVLPAIPATDPVLDTNADTRASSLPTLLQVPLIKTSNGEIHGIQSGRRSALLKLDGRWYRAKGCGDLYEGFPVAPVDTSPPSGAQNIRGCTFEHTSSRELKMTEVIQDALEPYGIQACNKSVGWWEYKSKDDKYPAVKRICMLSETLGNKRLGDNVITGLERLLPYLAKVENGVLLKAFPESRLDSDREGEVFETFMVTLTGAFGGEQDFRGFSFVERVNERFPGIDEKWHGVWDKAAELVNSRKEEGSLVAKLYWRFGYEAGKIFAALHLHPDEISWGTYKDLLGTHCNAHINNFVLLPPGASVAGNLLAPLDFDMAFTKSTFSKDDTLFHEWMELEKNGLVMVLAGDPELSTGVTATADLPKTFSNLRWALRDTMVVGFRAGLEAAQEKKVEILRDEKEEEVLYALLTLALIITEKETA